MDLLTWSMDRMAVFLLYFLRSVGFLTVVPLFSARAVPFLYQAALSFFLASILTITHTQPAPEAAVSSTGSFIAFATGEATLGLMMGFLVGLVFVVFNFAGSIVGYQMGFGIVNVLSPTTGQQTGLVGEFLFTLVSLLFLLFNFHHIFLLFWEQSFDLVALGAFQPASMGLDQLIGVAMDMFVIAVQVAVPILSVLLLTDFVLGIMARTMPTLNVFIVGLPLKIGLGLFFLGIIVATIGPVSQRTANKLVDSSAALVETMTDDEESESPDAEPPPETGGSAEQPATQPPPGGGEQVPGG